MHKIALISSLTRFYVVFSAYRLSKVLDMCEVTIQRSFIVPPGVEVISCALCVMLPFVVEVDVALQMITILADDHRSYGAEFASFDVNVFVKFFKGLGFNPLFRDIQEIVQH